MWCGTARRLVISGGALVTAGILASASVSPALAQASGPAAGQHASAAKGFCSSTKRPGLAERISTYVAKALAGRPNSTVGLAVHDARFDLTCSLHVHNHFIAASAMKVTIISALLLKVGGSSHLTKNQRNLAWLMITQSDNDAATDLFNEVGLTGMQRFLNRAKMTETELNAAWGLTLLTAHDEMTLLHLLTASNGVLSKNSRSYVRTLMAHVIASQRWGVSAGVPAGVTVHIKNGWLPYPSSSAPDWHINSIGAFTGKNIAYQIAILTAPSSASHPQQTESYGIRTIEAAAGVVNRQLGRAYAGS